MTQPDNLFPKSAANYSSFGEFANTSEAEWRLKMLDVLGEPWSTLLGLCQAILDNPFLGGLIKLAEDFLTDIEGIGQKLIAGTQFLFDTLCSIVTCGIYTPGGTTPQGIIAIFADFGEKLAMDVLKGLWDAYVARIVAIDNWLSHPAQAIHHAWMATADLIVGIVCDWAPTVYFNFVGTLWPDFFDWADLKEAYRKCDASLTGLDWLTIGAYWTGLCAITTLLLDIWQWSIVVLRNLSGIDFSGLWTAWDLEGLQSVFKTYGDTILGINWLSEPAGLMTAIGATIAFFKGLGRWLLATIHNVLAWDVSAVHAMFSSLPAFIQKIIEFFTGSTGWGLFQRVLDILSGVTGGSMSAAIKALMNFIPDLSNLFGANSFHGIITIFQSFIDDIVGLFGGHGTGHPLAAVTTTISSWLTSLPSMLLGLIENIDIAGMIQDALSFFDFSTIFHNLLQPWIDLWAALFGGGIGHTISSLMALIRGWIDGFAGLFGGLGLNGIHLGFANFLNDLRVVFGGGGGAASAQSVIATIATWISNVPTIAQFVSAITNGAGTTLMALTNWAHGLLTQASTVLSNNLSGAIPAAILNTVPFSGITSTSPNLLTDGAFRDALSVSAGDGWVFDGTASHGLFSGNGSVKVTCNGSRKMLYSNSVTVSGGNPLLLSGWVKWQSLAGGTSAITLSLATYAGSTAMGIVQIATGGSDGTHAWTELTAPAWQVPTGVDSVRVLLGTSAGSGTVWFDDVSLTRPSNLDSVSHNGTGNVLDDLTNYIHSLGAHPVVGTGQINGSSQNLLLNPIFLTANAFPAGDGWTWDGSVHFTDVGGSAKCVADGRKHGLLSNAILATPGDVITAFTYVKWTGYSGTGNPIDLMFNVYDHDGNYITEQWLDGVSSPSSSGGWQQIGATWTVPATINGVVPAEICLEFVVAREAAAGTIWFDNSSVTKAAALSGDLITTGDVHDGVVSGVRTTVTNIVERLRGWTDPETWTHPNAGDALGAVATTQAGLGAGLSDTRLAVADHAGLISNHTTQISGLVGTTDGLTTTATGLVSLTSNHTGLLGGLHDWAATVESRLLTLGHGGTAPSGGGGGTVTPPPPTGGGTGGTTPPVNQNVADDFQRSDSSGLGANWWTQYTAGNGFVYCDGSNAAWNANYPNGHREMIAVWNGTYAASAGDFQVNTIVLSTAPSSAGGGLAPAQVAKNGVLGRVNSSGVAQVAFWFGGDGSYQLTAGGSLLAQGGAGAIAVPGAGSTIALYCGDKATNAPQYYKVVINGSTLLAGNWAYGTWGASYRGRGMLFVADGVALNVTVQKPGSVNYWSGADQ